MTDLYCVFCQNNFDFFPKPEERLPCCINHQLLKNKPNHDDNKVETPFEPFNKDGSLTSRISEYFFEIPIKENKKRMEIIESNLNEIHQRLDEKITLDENNNKFDVCYNSFQNDMNILEKLKITISDKLIEFDRKYPADDVKINPKHLKLLNVKLNSRKLANPYVNFDYDMLRKECQKYIIYE